MLVALVLWSAGAVLLGGVMRDVHPSLRHVGRAYAITLVAFYVTVPMGRH